MELEQAQTLLSDPARGAEWLASLGVEDGQRGQRNLQGLAETGITLDLLAVIFEKLAAELPNLSDSDMALNNLERFVVAARTPLTLAALFERDRQALGILLEIFSTSEHLSNVLISDAESYDLLRLTEGRPVARETLVEEIASEVETQSDVRSVLETLRRYKRRETLRIAYGDIIREQPLHQVTAQIAYLADALLEAAVRFTRRQLEAARGVPRTTAGAPCRFVVLGLGKLGGRELNYSSDIDLICLYEEEGQTDGRPSLANAEFFAQLVRDATRLLTEATDLGAVYRVDLRLRPEGSRGPVAMSIHSAEHYYDTRGRTWERQAFIKARAVAGDLELGRRFLAHLEPWIYRNYLGLADIAGIKALKRRIEAQTRREGAENRDVKTGHGGIRDIEFVIQFLQLLNGGDLPQVRTTNTLEAIVSLEQVGCLTNQERVILEENYSFLRKLEHRLQIMFDLQTHRMPSEPAELRKLALRMDYRDENGQTALDIFEPDYQERTKLNRSILDHLLHDAFGDDPGAEPEVDLVFDPDPSPEKIRQVLGRYGFADVPQAYLNLMDLANEKIPFLSTRRCRMFLASIAPKLLKAIAARPDPDSTLVNLCRVSDSLGGKGVLWELFSFNTPSLELCVDICASSPYLCGMLTSNPGMIDELMDSLLLSRLPSLQTLAGMLVELCRAAEDTEPILHSFKNSQQLRVGGRDILGKEDILETTGGLSDIAEACLRQITEMEYQKLVQRLGEPVIAEGPRANHVCELIILAMGKFGGRELNYHSDLDIVFLYEEDGATQHRRSRRGGETTSNRHFFSELGQRVINVGSRLGPFGRLYEIDPRLRPTGKSGPLATSLDEFARYFAEGDAALWERMALCRARVVLANEVVFDRVNGLIRQAAFSRPLSSSDMSELADMRRRLEESAGPRNLKRGRGGIVDIEFITQLLQLREGHERASIREPNTLLALDRLHEAGVLDKQTNTFLADGYRLLRKLESRLRLMHTTSRDDLPEDEEGLAKLARLVGYDSPAALTAELERVRKRNRELFERFFKVPSPG